MGGDSSTGVAGTCELLNQRDVSTQPIIAFDWHPDKEGLAVMGSLDQTVKVAICELNTERLSTSVHTAFHHRRVPDSGTKLNLY